MPWGQLHILGASACGQPALKLAVQKVGRKVSRQPIEAPDLVRSSWVGTEIAEALNHRIPELTTSIRRAYGCVGLGVLWA